MSYAEELLGPYIPLAQREAEVARRLAETHRRQASELRAMLAGKPNEWAPALPGLTPAQARALAEQVVAGQCSATPGEMAVARAWLAGRAETTS